MSAVVSLTLTPMMCARLLAPGTTKAARLGRFSAGSGPRDRGYGRRSKSCCATSRRRYSVARDGRLTIWLYVIMPKGFLPDQDTGRHTAVVEGGPQISFTEMRRLQGDIAKIVAQDPDVSGVASIVGIGQLNATQNVGNLKIMLKPRSKRQSNVDGDHPALKHESRSVAGTIVHFQPVQDVQISTQRAVPATSTQW